MESIYKLINDPKVIWGYVLKALRSEGSLSGCPCASVWNILQSRDWHICINSRRKAHPLVTLILPSLDLTWLDIPRGNLLFTTVFFSLVFVFVFILALSNLGEWEDRRCGAFVFTAYHKGWLGSHSWLCLTWVTSGSWCREPVGLCKELLSCSHPSHLDWPSGTLPVPDCTERLSRELSKRLRIHSRENIPLSSSLASALLVAGNRDWLFWQKPTMLSYLQPWRCLSHW